MQAAQLPDLAECETYVLAHFDEHNVLQVLVRKRAIAGCRAPRFSQYLLALVESDRLDVDSSFLGKLPNLHHLSVNPILWYRVKAISGVRCASQLARSSRRYPGNFRDRRCHPSAPSTDSSRRPRVRVLRAKVRGAAAP